MLHPRTFWQREGVFVTPSVRIATALPPDDDTRPLTICEMLAWGRAPLPVLPHGPRHRAVRRRSTPVRWLAGAPHAG